MATLTLDKNLQQLMQLHGNLTTSELSRKVDVPQPTLHHILNGNTKKPRRNALEALANYFSISIAQLTGEEPLPQKVPISVKGASNIVAVNIITWETLKKQLKHGFKFSGQDEIIIHGHYSSDTFALIMSDSSMEPIFSENTLLIFDPNKKAKDRDFVLVYLNKKDNIIFKRLFIDSGEYYIKADSQNSNEIKLCKLDKNDKIIASLVESRVRFRD